MIINKKPAVLVLFILAAGSLLLTGCTRTTVAVGDAPGYRHGPPPWAPAHGYRAKYTYRYYPSLQVYYDINRGIYFYHSERRWRTSHMFPVYYHSRPRDTVILHMTTGRPYKYHKDVVKRYPPGQARGKGRGR